MGVWLCYAGRELCVAFIPVFLRMSMKIMVVAVFSDTLFWVDDLQLYFPTRRQSGL
jgi:hypothetical protein